jgi:hypothetical protein
VDTNIPNPNAAFDFISIKRVNLLLINNDSYTDRNPLVAALSTDNDKSYRHRMIIKKENGGDFGYPYVIQTRDEKIHLIYTSHERTVINHATFEESDVIKSKTKPKKYEKNPHRD